jgi:hypothetical protein
MKNLLGVFKPGAVHTIARFHGYTVSLAPIKALPCLCFSRLWRRKPSHPLRGWSVTQTGLKKDPDNPACLADLSRRSFYEGGSFSEGG